MDLNQHWNWCAEANKWRATKVRVQKKVEELG